MDTNSDWVRFMVFFNGRDAVQQTLDACRQNYYPPDMNCTYQGPGGWPVDITGSYVLASAYSIGTLIEEEIDRSQTGYPYDPCGDQFFILVDYILGVLELWNYPAYRDWEIIAVAALAALVDLTVDPSGPALGPETSTWELTDEEPCLKVAAHAIVAACSWENHTPSWIRNEIELFCDSPSCTPSYVYCIHAAYADILDPYVGNKETSWGGIKAMYR